ncbi:sucrase ferredoxin [Mumia sp. DW29H23]|uniref:sucrase ferredoxin n=1 Tax=Mumia sp. DW29H23 TaxID=3421241 RepID=UPI003D68E41E
MPEGAAPADPFRCAAAARGRHDPLAATATPAQRWLLVEHPGPWPFNAFASDAIEPEVLGELAAAIRVARSRLLMIRRPGRQVDTTERRWAVMDNDAGHGAVWGTWRRSSDLREAAAVVREPLGPATGPPRTTLLVCTHGRHDVCCAIRGRPVASALAERWPDETWECSHIGGDRFAANVVVLPGGTTYGNLDADSAVDVVSSHLAGAVVPAYLRGVASAPPFGQAAVVAAHERYGPLPAEAVRFVEGRRTGTGSWVAEVAVVRDGRTTRLVADVVATERVPAMLTCAAHQETSATSYTVARVEAGE